MASCHVALLSYNDNKGVFMDDLFMRNFILSSFFKRNRDDIRMDTIGIEHR